MGLSLGGNRCARRWTLSQCQGTLAVIVAALEAFRPTRPFFGASAPWQQLRLLRRYFGPAAPAGARALVSLAVID